MATRHYICMFVCAMHVCMYARMYVCIYVCVLVCMCVEWLRLLIQKDQKSSGNPQHRAVYVMSKKSLHRVVSCPQRSQLIGYCT